MLESNQNLMPDSPPRRLLQEKSRVVKIDEDD